MSVLKEQSKQQWRRRSSTPTSPSAGSTSTSRRSAKVRARPLLLHTSWPRPHAVLHSIPPNVGLHVAGELGTVVFLHGFPEIWYSWRHQMLAAAAAGYRAIAPDCRGYGLSDQPPENEEASWSWEDLVADVLAILDALSVPKVGLRSTQETNG
jgi:pimeloyl-ACP methyl ester carboxylesterase